MPRTENRDVAPANGVVQAPWGARRRIREGHHIPKGWTFTADAETGPNPADAPGKATAPKASRPTRGKKGKPGPEETTEGEGPTETADGGEPVEGDVEARVMDMPADVLTTGRK